MALLRRPRTSIVDVADTLHTGNTSVHSSLHASPELSRKSRVDASPSGRASGGGSHRESHRSGERERSSKMAPCASNTARVGEALSRMLHIVGQPEAAARAARRTIEALQVYASISLSLYL